MKFLFVSIMMSFVYLNGLAQQEYSTVQIDISDISSDNPTDWTTYIDNVTFKIEYKMVNCDPNKGFDFEAVFFKVTNKTLNELAVAWHKNLYYGGICRTCDYPEEYSFELSLGPNQIVQGDCDPQTGYQLKLFSRFNDTDYSRGDALTAFKLDNFTATQD
ncbi:MAG: hypothetical protein ACI865_003172 [Flavobacteriaceae bacterium]|jgi:hypothetical protein